MAIALAETLNSVTLRNRNTGLRIGKRNSTATTGAIVALIAIGLCATPFANLQLVPIPGYMAAFGTAMIVINVLLASILFSRGAIERRADATALGTAYLFVAAIFVPLVASFPDAIVGGALIGIPGSSVWLWLFWHAGFGVAILHYASVASQPARPSASVAKTVLTVMGVVSLLAVSATRFLQYLPATLQNGHTLFGGLSGAAPLATLGILIFATVRVARLRVRTPEQVSLAVAMVAACVDVWLTYQGTDRYSLGWYLAKCGSLFTSLAVLISLLHQINRLYSQAAGDNTVLEGLALRDGLTGLTNRRGLDEALEAEWRKCRRERQPLSLLMIDVDHFKKFNDRYGHPAGDACLRQVGEALQAVARRPADVAARYGGEEFAMLLPATDALGAVEMAVRVQKALRALAMPHADSPHGAVSVSIGLANAAPEAAGDAAELVAAADRGLYCAKAAGRNTSCWSDESEWASVAPPLSADATEAAASHDKALARDEAPARDEDARSAAEAVACQEHESGSQSCTPPHLAGVLQVLERIAMAAPRHTLRPPSGGDNELLALQCEVVAAVAAGRPLPEVATLLCHRVERLTRTAVCSVLTVDAEGRLRPLAGPSLPEAFSRAIDGLPIGQDVGSCGTAAYYGYPVEVRDLETDPRWAAYKDMPLAAGLRACWSSPIKSGDGNVVGTFAFYFRSRRSPTAFEREIVDKSVQLCAMAIERDAVLQRLQEANQRFDIAISNMSQGLCFFSKGKLIVANRRYSEIYDLPPNSVGPGTTLEEIVDLRIAAGSGPVMPADHYLDWRNTVNAGEGLSNTTVTLANGRVISIHHQPMPNGGWVATHEDITERQRAEAKIVHAAHHDGLTGLPNRVLFHERTQQALAQLGRGQNCTALCLDIDHFKTINETFGHATGDWMLQGVAERLQACVREGDTVARLGGDEFAILLVGVEHPESVGDLVQRMSRALKQPFFVSDQSIELRASMGIAIAPEDGATPDKLLQSAETALYRAKQDEPGSYRFFEPEMNARLQARFLLERDLRLAVQTEQFELAYQPVFNLSANEIAGFEALLRWQHPSRGMVSPGEFIPLMEETGLIVPIGAWVLRQACAAAAAWPRPVKVAVNLSAVQFKSRGLVETVRQALVTSELSPTRLELEITESVLLNDNADTLATLHALRDLGVSIAMDDFGTGYSSLSYLRSFPFDKIKIDQSFIRDITAKEESIAITRAVVGLGRSMGMVTTAEGVETEHQLAQLRREGCTEVQGFLLSRPISDQDARRLLSAECPADELFGTAFEGPVRLDEPALV